MWKDEIVEEVRQAREAYAARFDYDLEAIYRDIKQQEQQERLNGRVYITLPPKRVGEEALQTEQAKAA